MGAVCSIGIIAGEDRAAILSERAISELDNENERLMQVHIATDRKTLKVYRYMRENIHVRLGVIDDRTQNVSIPFTRVHSDLANAIRGNADQLALAHISYEDMETMGRRLAVELLSLVWDMRLPVVWGPGQRFVNGQKLGGLDIKAGTLHHFDHLEAVKADIHSKFLTMALAWRTKGRLTKKALNARVRHIVLQKLQAIDMGDVVQRLVQVLHAR